MKTPAHNNHSRMRAYIYALFGQDSPKDLMYIGQTGDPVTRLLTHYDSNTVWIKHLRKTGKQLCMEILGCFPWLDIRVWERAFITAARRDGHRLTNKLVDGPRCNPILGNFIFPVGKVISSEAARRKAQRSPHDGGRLFLKRAVEIAQIKLNNRNEKTT